MLGNTVRGRDTEVAYRSNLQGGVYKMQRNRRTLNRSSLSARWCYVLLPLGLFGHGESAPAADANCFNWVTAGDGGPIARRTTLAYDSQRNVTVLFGGEGAGGDLGDTWEWNGSFWTEIQVDGPSPRSSHAMSYDSDRGVIVMYGGYLATDTWEWDGIQWIQADLAGPGLGINQDAAMVYDQERSATLLFNSGETWTWDGADWTLVSADPDNDPQVGAASMVFDEARGVAVLFGGLHITTSQTMGDTWEWDGTIWTEVASTGPSPRWLASAAYDAARAKCIMYGGFSGSSGLVPLDGTWEWDGSIWVPVTNTKPPARGFPAMAYDSATTKTMVFGGRERLISGSYFSDTWETDIGVPVITGQPVDVVAVEGGPAGFGVGVIADVPLSYQWYKSLGAIPGATHPYLLFGQVNAEDQSSSYQLEITGSCGIVYSDPATLTVIPRADLDFDGDVDLRDHEILSFEFTGPIP